MIKMRFYQLYQLLYIFVIFISISCQKQNLGDSRNFVFTYEVHLDSTDQKVEVWIPIAQSNEAQIITNEILNSGFLSCEKLKEEAHSNYYYYCFSNTGLPEDMTLSYSCNVKRFEHNLLSHHNVDPTNYDKGTNNLTVPEGDIFKDIINENNLTSTDMRGVYDYVFNGMHYGKPTDDKDNPNYKYINGGVNKNTGKEWLPKDITYGRLNVTQDMLVEKQNKKESYAYGNGNAIYACDIGVGNCTDYHSYFMSLSRTLDVSARFHMGFPIPDGEEGKVGGYHCWADYYVENQGWYPVDISEADKAPEKSDYFFGTVCQNRVEFTTGRDLQLKNHKNNVNFFIYPLVEGTDFTKSFSYKNIK